MHLEQAVAWPTSPASIRQVFPLGHPNTLPKIWPQSADLVVSKCLLQSTDPLCRTIFRVFASLVRGQPLFLCPALFQVHEKRPKALAVPIGCLLHHRQDLCRILEGVHRILCGVLRILEGVLRILDGV